MMDLFSEERLHEMELCRNLVTSFQEFKTLSEDKQKEEIARLLRILHKHLLRLNCYGVMPETKIYRIIKFKHFCSLFEDENLRLVRPSTWNEPWGHWPFNLEFFVNGRMMPLLQLLGKCYYAQCWSLEKDGEGLWDFYTDPKDRKSDNFMQHSIQIQTTAEALLGSIYRLQDRGGFLNFHIGAVKYCSLREVVKKTRQIQQALKNGLFFTGSSDNWTLLEKLLIKPLSLSFEREVRLIADNPDYQYQDSDELNLHVEPKSLIQGSIIADPWCSDSIIKQMQGKVHELNESLQVEKSPNYSSIFQKAVMEGFHEGCDDSEPTDFCPCNI